MTIIITGDYYGAPKSIATAEQEDGSLAPKHEFGEAATVLVNALIAAMTKMHSAPKHAEVTPSDSTTFTGVTALFIGTGGDVIVTDSAGNDATYTVLDGTLLPVQAAKVKLATTASDIVRMGSW